MWLWLCVADLSSSPPGPYGQEQYVFRPQEHFKAPPILPPHLLQVILNKDTNISVSVSSFLSCRYILFVPFVFPCLCWPSASLFTPVRPGPAAWTQPRHAKPPLRPFNKGRLSKNTPSVTLKLNMLMKPWCSALCRMEWWCWVPLTDTRRSTSRLCSTSPSNRTSTLVLHTAFREQHECFLLGFFFLILLFSKSSCLAKSCTETSLQASLKKKEKASGCDCGLVL